MNETILTTVQESPWISSYLMSFFSNLGHGEFYLLTTILMMWCIDYKRGLFFALVVSFTTLTTEGLKLVLQQTRPYTEGINIQDFGMPSAHASTAVVFFGMLSAWYKKHYLSILSVCSILIIGLSRVYLTVHFPSQVLYGYALGVTILLLSLKLKKVMLRKVGIAILLLTTVPILISLVGNVGRDNLKHMMQVTGLILGLFHALFRNKNMMIHVRGSFRDHVIKILFFMVILVVFFGLKTMMKQYISHYLFYIFLNLPLHYLLSITLSYWMPKYFAKLKLMTIERV